MSCDTSCDRFPVSHWLSSAAVLRFDSDLSVAAFLLADGIAEVSDLSRVAKSLLPSFLEVFDFPTIFLKKINNCSERTKFDATRLLVHSLPLPGKLS